MSSDDEQQRARAIARARLRERADVRAWIERTADEAPPLTEQQRATLARLLTLPRSTR